MNKKKKTKRRTAKSPKLMLGFFGDIDATVMIDRPVMLSLRGANPVFGLLRVGRAGPYLSIRLDGDPDDMVIFSSGDVTYVGALPKNAWERMISKGAAAVRAMLSGSEEDNDDGN